MAEQSPAPAVGHSGSTPGSRLALFELGFRPFFLLAGIAAVLLVGWWTYAYTVGRFGPVYYPATVWHSHEMLFGYTVAVIAGFLLTAVRNWTGYPTSRGATLTGLVALWLAGRVAPLLSGLLPHWSIAALDVAFLPVLAVALAVPVVRSRQPQQLVFLFVLAALTAANLMVHLEVLGVTRSSAGPGLFLGVYLVVFLISIVAGRVLPFFIETGIDGATTRQWALVDYFSLVALAVLIVLDLVDAAPELIVVAALLSAAGHTMRLLGWHQRKLWSVPLLWVLYVGYAWLIAGFLLTAASAAGLINPMLATHAFTAGAIGTLTLGMMVRVTLGHTGRELQAAPVATWTFVLVTLAAVVRVFLPVLFPAGYRGWILLAGILWSVAFVLFVLAYGRILIQPRIDGQPG